MAANASTEAPAEESQALFAEVLRLKKLALTMTTTARHPAIRIQVVKIVESFVLCFSSAEVRDNTHDTQHDTTHTTRHTTHDTTRHTTQHTTHAG